MAGRKSGGLGRELARVRSALRFLDASLRELARAAANPQPRSAELATATAPRKLKLSPARLKALRLHGRYLGYIRQLKPRLRAEMKAVRKKRGIEAAIKRAKRLVSSK